MCERYIAFWICQNMPWWSSEYNLGSRYARILNMQELYRVLNMSQHGWICLNRTWICLNMSEFTIIDRVLNKDDTIHSANPLYKLITVVLPCKHNTCIRHWNDEETTVSKWNKRGMLKGLLKDRCVKNPVKDLAWSVLEK